MNNNWITAFMHPQAKVLKDFVYQLIEGEWVNHEEILERISPQLVTEKDLDAAGSLFVAIYKAGFTKAIEEHRIEFEKVGIKPVVKNAKVIFQKEEKPKIFNR